MRQSVSAVELGSESLGRPDSDAQTPIAHGHGFGGRMVGLAQNKVGAADQARSIHDELAGFPRCSGMTVLRHEVNRAAEAENEGTTEPMHPSCVPLCLAEGQFMFVPRSVTAGPLRFCMESSARERKSDRGAARVFFGSCT